MVMFVRRRWVPAAALAALSLVAVACGSSSGGQATSSTTTTTGATGASSTDALYAAAKKEGSLTLYTTANPVQVQPAVDGFEKRYPGIKVNWTRTATPDLIQRFSSEESSGTHNADVIHMTDTNFLQSAIGTGLLVALDKAGLPGGFPGSFPKAWVLAAGAFGMQTMSPSGIGFNTRMLTADQAPKDYEQLLDPTWKGKIIAFDPNKVGASMWDFWDFIEKTYGPTFLTKFKDQKPIWYGGAVPGQNANAAGEAPVLVPAFPSLVYQVKGTGGPVEMTVPTKTTGVLYAALPSAKAPHPNAARLFVHDLYEKISADGFANVPLQVSPYGGGMGKAPTGFVAPDSAGAATAARKAELSKLLGLPYAG